MTDKKTPPTGFDAFFNAVTASPEFKASVTKDWKWDTMDALEETLKSMESSVSKASEMMKNFDTTFNTPEARSTWEAIHTSGEKSTPDKKTGNAQNENTPPTIEVEHFEKKPNKPWGFEAVAGMDALKKELTESFIKPLKFKFLIEKLQKEQKERTDTNTKEHPTTEANTSDTNTNNDIVMKLYEEYQKFQISIPTGMLLYGPPGTGKTFITKKLAEELECGYISKNMGEFGSSYLHQTTKNIKDFFAAAKQASQNEPILLFLDEIDSLVSARTNNVDANKAEEVSQFLQEFNSLAEEAPNLIVVAATNRPDHLDSALLRSGRLDKKIYIGPPDDIAREELFRMYIEKSNRPHEPLDYKQLSILTTGYVSADIKAICDEVARDASKNLLELIDEAQNGKLTTKDLEGNSITMDLLRKTILETPSSLKMVDMSVYENWLQKIQ